MIGLVIPAIPILLKMADTYFSGRVPAEVTTIIDSKVKSLVEDTLRIFLANLEETKRLYNLLALVSLVLIITQYFLSSEILKGIVTTFVYVIPIFMTIRTTRNIFKGVKILPDVEKKIIDIIDFEFKNASWDKKILLELYEKRTSEDLAKLFMGGLVFELITYVKVYRKVLLSSLVSFFVAYLNIILLRVI